MKKTWEKPRLICLVRNRPEEAVLQACKDGLDTGPDGYNAMCFQATGQWCDLNVLS